MWRAGRVAAIAGVLACGLLAASGPGRAASVADGGHHRAREVAQGRGTFADLLQSVFSYFKTGIEALWGREGAANALVGTSKVKYTNYQLLRAKARTETQLNEVMELGQEMDGDVRFWTLPRRNAPMDILVAPDAVEEVKVFLKKRGIKYEVVIQDLQQMITMQNPKMTKDQRDILRSQVGHSMTFKRYHRYSGTHAREWISPASALYILKQLVENFKVNKNIVEGVDWYVMPMVNPDGYEYSHTTDRLWRKTRSKSDSSSSEEDSDDDDELSIEAGSTGRRGSSRKGRVFWDRCEGVDLNRNWDFHWGGRGASDDPCDETYAGPKPFSEPETRAIADYLMNNRDKFKVFISLHSYAQMWLLPWGFTKTAPDDHNELMAMGRTAVEAITKVGGSKYDIGGATSLLYHSSGGADDWAKGVAGIKYTYTVELRDTGNYGFLLPASQIIPTGKEIFAGVKAMAKSLINKTN